VRHPGTFFPPMLFLPSWAAFRFGIVISGAAFCFHPSLQGGCRTGMAKMTNAYDLPARLVISFCSYFPLGIYTLFTHREAHMTDNPHMTDFASSMLVVVTL
jgi:hypothetical protein